MNLATLSLHHLIRSPKVESDHPPLLILLHGIGSNEQDLFSLAPYLDTRFIIASVRGPVTLMPGAYAWFHAEFIGDHSKINAAEAEASRLLVLDFIREAALAYKADPARVYLMGFSQGAIMSLSVMLTIPEALAGVVAMSGRILAEVKPLTAAPDKLHGFPVMVVHGVNDSVLSISHGRASRDFLSTLPVRLKYREYQMGHEISEASLHDVREWLSDRLDTEESDSNG